ncbi:GNAT family N-acetyltransferase [Oceanirhabdus sp. W0125-5]|uniref:GNAT family N-acetyltransferase n=1 Tax=Oceanirhabdus sp. W0125-5 TaxID=2999116 RepID=UPI0022F33E27|nr:GNAT family N-acetyltransferase [Oceanirhabdus sp. W0125-5]WBW96680.1 GNAT family N-acetyltransferase [Oceanirhabdus sp. W0125-5]
MDNTSREIKLKKLPIERYEEFLRILDKAYEMKEDKWFMKNLPHIYANDDLVNMSHVVGGSNSSDLSDLSDVGIGQAKEMIQWNYINEEGGDITSGLGIFPQQLRAKCAGKDIVFDLGGIGSVFAVKEHRGKGGMSSALKDAINIMTEDKYQLSWLSGDRYRYRNYGWDYAGSYYKFTVYMRDLERYFTDINECDSVIPTDEQISSLKKIYSMFESGIVRDDEMWRTHLSRKNLNWSYVEKDDKKAYMVQYGNNADFIPEIQGDAECAVMLLMNHMRKENLEKVIILAPSGDTLMNKLLKHISGDMVINNCGSIKIMDYDCIWEMIKDNFNHVDKQIDKNMRNAFIRRIFGFWYDDIELTDGLKQLAERYKINWWMSTLDMV